MPEKGQIYKNYDMEDGYVISAKVSIENGADKQMWYSNYHRLQLTNDFDFFQSDLKSFVPGDQQIHTIKKNKLPSPRLSQKRRYLEW